MSEICMGENGMTTCRPAGKGLPKKGNWAIHGRFDLQLRTASLTTDSRVKQFLPIDLYGVLRGD
jgi:hypothetical protein